MSWVLVNETSHVSKRALNPSNGGTAAVSGEVEVSRLRPQHEVKSSLGIRVMGGELQLGKLCRTRIQFLLRGNTNSQSIETEFLEWKAWLRIAMWLSCLVIWSVIIVLVLLNGIIQWICYIGEILGKLSEYNTESRYTSKTWFAISFSLHSLRPITTTTTTFICMTINTYSVAKALVK